MCFIFEMVLRLSWLLLIFVEVKIFSLMLSIFLLIHLDTYIPTYAANILVMLLLNTKYYARVWQ